jgi:two-component system response regulator NreC
VQAYIVKDSTLPDLITAVHEVSAGRRFISPSLPKQLLVSSKVAAEPARESTFEKLTAREREVFQLVAQGRTNAEAATLLFISPRTVEIRRAATMKKLGRKNQIELVAFAIKRGVVKI